ncbi:MAG TPA: hypothetical protein PKV48_04645 [Thermodesulfobacteriota bacterium]|nr:hypothetical protein [Thermodesulfobacteriota bacterium]
MICECDSCGNSYALTWINEGEDYNDFGIRYCPFCGLMFETLPIGGETASRKSEG